MNSLRTPDSWKPCAQVLALTGVFVVLAAQAQTLAPASAEMALRQIVDAGRLDALRWPNFSDYRLHVKNFYAPTSYELAWTRSGQASPQSLGIIKILQAAAEKSHGATAPPSGVPVLVPP